MIRLDRSKTKPEADWRDSARKALPDFAAFEREARRFEALLLNCPERRKGFAMFAPAVLKKERGQPSFPSLWSTAKSSLAEMSRRKCAYCEGEINAERSGQVEHFKPKALFPSSAYDWGNYFLACGGCNGEKSDKWPERGGYLRPDRGDPSRRLRFSRDGKVQAARRDRMVDRTIADFGLNRKWLAARREKHIRQMIGRVNGLQEVFAIAPKLGRRLLSVELDRLRDPGNAYSAALTQCFFEAAPASFRPSGSRSRR